MVSGDVFSSGTIEKYVRDRQWATAVRKAKEERDSALKLMQEAERQRDVFKVVVEQWETADPKVRDRFITTFLEEWPQYVRKYLDRAEYAEAIVRKRDAEIVELVRQRDGALSRLGGAVSGEINCGMTYLDSDKNERVDSLRGPGGSDVGAGCDKLLSVMHAYRCLDCGRWFCKTCLEKHFATEGDPVAKALRYAETRLAGVRRRVDEFYRQARSGRRSDRLSVTVDDLAALLEDINALTCDVYKAGIQAL